MTPTPAQVEALIDRMGAEADLCRSETAEDIAKLLDEAASALAALRGENAAIRKELTVEVLARTQAVDALAIAKTRIAKAEEILKPLYECDPAIRVWFGDPAYGRAAQRKG